MSRRRQGKRASTRDHEQGVQAGVTCPCGKIRYRAKTDAKRAARRIKGRDGRVHPYRCGDFWHLGHPPRALVAGQITRDDIIRRTA